MKAEEQHLLRQRAADNLFNLAGKLIDISHQVNADVDIDEYFEQLGIQKVEISNNLAFYADQLQSIRFRLNNRRFNANVIGQLIAHLMVWLSENIIYNGQTSPIKRATLLLQIDCKLECFMQFSESAIYFEQDIASAPFFSAQYEPVYKHIKFIDCENPIQTRQQYNRVRSLMIITNAAVLTELAQSNCILGVAAFGISFPRFLIDFSEAELRCHAFFRKPKLSQLQEIWNLPQKGAINQLKYLQFQSIGTNQQLYVPTLQSAYASPLIPNPEAIKIRVLSSSKINFWSESQIQSVGCSCWWSEPEKVQNTIILHAHGGGFIALSSSTMESYTRRWANSLGVVVISIDYSKPPQHTFPRPVHDMLAVYRFVTQQLEKHCKIKPKNIILAGDSAGGNLMCSLMGLIIKYNLLMPIGMFLAYPACDLRKIYSPSRLHSFTDAILQPSLLLLCLKEYLGINQDKNQYDPLASPLLLSEQYVSGKKGDFRFPIRWPITHIMIGQLDPLLDDTLRFCQRLKQSNINYECRIYKQLGHGFLSVEKMISQGQQGIIDSIDILRYLIQKANT